MQEKNEVLRKGSVFLSKKEVRENKYIKMVAIIHPAQTFVSAPSWHSVAEHHILHFPAMSLVFVC